MMTTKAATPASAKRPTLQNNWRWQAHQFKAMNTTVHVWLYSQTSHQLVLTGVQHLFESFEKRLSRFDPHSELSQLNNAETGVFNASPILLDTVEAALAAAQATHGLYDPTILTCLEEAGYNRSFEQIENPRSLHTLAGLDQSTRPAQAIRSRFSYLSVQLNRATHQIYKPVGVRLDLGGMGKGWTVDRAADSLQGLGPFLINAGGDIFAYQTPAGQKGWPIDLIHPLEPARFMARLHLHHRALATSTIAKRRWQHNGHLMHHLIDPRTGRPAQTDALSVTVVADRTMLAEVQAKVALILGAEQGLAYLQSLPNIEGLIYTTDSKIIYTTGFAPLLERVEADGYLASHSPRSEEKGYYASP